jgi:cytochrome c oxidase subunit 2
LINQPKKYLSATPHAGLNRKTSASHPSFRYCFFAKGGVAAIPITALPGGCAYAPSCLLLGSMLDPQSAQAEAISRLTIYFFVAGGFIFLLVCVLTAVFLEKFRARPGDKEKSGQRIKSRKIEWLMVGVPLLMVSLFFVLTVRAMHEIQPPVGNTRPEVVITAHQWWWGAEYPSAGVTTANEIHLPVGRNILLRMSSADVIHNWWVPQLGNKMDVLPGRFNYLWLHINKPGYYEGACSEFCGQQHAWMRIRVYAQPEHEYRQWLASQSRPAAAPEGELAARGAGCFQALSCGDCHHIAGAAAASNEGPSLTHFASRQTMLTGKLRNDSASLDAWLANPQHIKPGAYMPDFLLEDTTRQALVAYLMQLK